MTSKCDAHFLNIIGGKGGEGVILYFFAVTVEIKRRTIYIGKKVKFLPFTKCLKCFRLMRIYILFQKVLEYFFVLLNRV
jgi:hypothetical protein